MCLRTMTRESSEVVGVVGSLIRDKREAKGLSQTQLAEVLGTTQRQITRWESYTKQLPRGNARMQLGEVLEISLAEFHAAAAEAEEVENLASASRAIELSKRLGPRK